MRQQLQYRRNLEQRGMSLIELMLAMAVLAICLMGTMPLFVSAIVSNSRNKNDTAATMVAQLVIEQIVSQKANTNPALAIIDCTGVSRSINTTGSSSGSGTQLYTAATAPMPSMVGSIDFTQAVSSVPAGYRTLYVLCDANGVQSTYDVRWNISTFSSQTKAVVVAAQPLGATNNVKMFAVPVTLRSIAGS